MKKVMKDIFLKLMFNILKNYLNFITINPHDKTEYIIHIRNSRQAVSHGLVLTKVQKVVKFNQYVWLKPYIDMKTDLRKKVKMILKNIF